MIDKICERCGKGFSVYPYRAETARFCSQKCSVEWLTQVHNAGHKHPNWHGGGVMRTCEWCGGEFKIQPSVVAKGKAKYCSRKCFDEWFREHPHRGEANVWWTGGNVSVECKQCGKVFEVCPSYAKSGKGKVCSKSCANKWYRGERHCSWRGGKSFEPYGLEFNEVLKESIRHRDGYVCRMTGKSQDEVGTLHVHHIDYDKKNNARDNLISLSSVAHARTGSNRKLWEAVLCPIAHRMETGGFYGRSG